VTPALVRRLHTCDKDCYGACVFEGTWDDAAKLLVSATPSKAHPFTRGFFCAKYANRPAQLYREDRLTVPLVRSGSKGTNEFTPASGDDAWAILATKAKEIIDRFGPGAVLGAYYSGNTGILSGAYPLRVFNALGATVTAGGICNEGGIAGLKELFGTYSTTNPLQLASPDASLIVVWGSDLSAHNIHAYQLVREAQRRGTMLAVIDTRRTETAANADVFIHATPGTEGVIALVAAKRAIAAGGLDAAFIDEHVNIDPGLIETIQELDDDHLLQKAEVEADAINAFVDALIAHQHHTIFNVGYGIQKDVYGGETVKAIALLQILLGNIGKPGCGVVYSQSGIRRDIFNGLWAHVSGSEVLGSAGEVPIVELAGALESGRYKLLIVYNFNPASSLPDQARLRTQLAREDIFMVVLDLFLNATTRYADLVFPAKAGVETDDLIWGYYMPGLSANNAGPCPYPDCESNVEFFQHLATVLGLDQGEHASLFLEPDAEIVRQCLDLAGRDVEDDVASKGYHLFVDAGSVLYEDLQFPTSDGRIRAMLPVTQVREKEPGSFFLITPQHIGYLHSQLGVMAGEQHPEFDHVFLHPIDASLIGLTEGDAVIVSSRDVAREYVLGIDGTLKHGTVLLYSGGPSAENGACNANFFTPGTPERSGHSGSYNSGIVSIRRAG